MKTGAQLIAEERERQMTKEGWSAEHDDMHNAGELLDASGQYLQFASFQVSTGRTDGTHYFHGMPPTPYHWPWDGAWWKPSDTDPIRNLVKAGALIAAEIDRLQRAEGRGK